MRLHPGIRIHSMPVAGTAGLIVAAGITVLILVAVPALQPPAALCLGGGVLPRALAPGGSPVSAGRPEA